jgi:stage V sporulation protein SpoVS
VHRIEWKVPTPDFVFEAELNAGVRTAGFLAKQTPEALAAIRAAINQAVRAYAHGDGFAIPKGAYVVGVRKAI